jgi:arylsulfatase
MERPNILWICTDQQRFDTIEALGNQHIRTPNLNKLVETGVAFLNAYCQSPICTPSRASFLTGMYPSSVHGCMNGNDYWSGAAPLVTKLFSDSGYDCGLIGKLHLAGNYKRIEPRGDDGYRYFKWSPIPIDLWKEGHDYADWVRDKGYNLSDFIEPPKGDLVTLNDIKVLRGIPASLHQSTWCAERAIEFIKEERTEPWLLSLNPFDPHPPFNPPEDYYNRFDPSTLPEPLFDESDLASQAKLENVDFQTKCCRPDMDNALKIKAAYYAMIELIDAMVGKVIASLKESGQYDNTVIIFTSDHGEALGDHGLLLKGCRFYDGLTRVPLIVSWPKVFKEGLRSTALIELTDLAPTLLGLCNIDIPEKMQGKSALKILTGEKGADCHRDTVRCEYYRAVNPNWRPHMNGTYGNMIRDERYKLSIYHGKNIGELFDLYEDPNEFNNLWDDPKYNEVKCDLLIQCIDGMAFSVDVGPKQVVRW